MADFKRLTRIDGYWVLRDSGHEFIERGRSPVMVNLDYVVTTQLDAFGDTTGYTLVVTPTDHFRVVETTYEIFGE